MVEEDTGVGLRRKQNKNLAVIETSCYVLCSAFKIDRIKKRHIVSCLNNYSSSLRTTT